MCYYIMNKNIINVTKKAFEKMSTIIKKSDNQKGFLFGVSSGGCNGFNFNLNLITDEELKNIEKMKPNIVEHEDVKVYVDPIAEMHLIGTTIDYVKEDFNKGIFESKFIYNIDKEKASSCGCGVSFMPRNL